MASPDEYIESSEVEDEEEEEDKAKWSTSHVIKAMKAIWRPMRANLWRTKNGKMCMKKKKQKTDSRSKSFKVDLTAQYKWSLGEFPRIIVRF